MMSSDCPDQASFEDIFISHITNSAVLNLLLTTCQPNAKVNWDKLFLGCLVEKGYYDLAKTLLIKVPHQITCLASAYNYLEFQISTYGIFNRGDGYTLNEEICTQLSKSNRVIVESERIALIKMVSHLLNRKPAPILPILILY